MFILTSPYQQQPFGKRTMRVVIILMTAYLTVIITSKMMKLISTVDKFNYFKDFWLSANVLKRYDLYDMFFMRRYNGHWLLVLLHFLPRTSGLDVISLTSNRKCGVLWVLALPVNFYSNSDQNQAHDRRNGKQKQLILQFVGHFGDKKGRLNW